MIVSFFREVVFDVFVCMLYSDCNVEVREVYGIFFNNAPSTN